VRVEDPQKLLPNTSMPRTGVTKESMEKLISYFESVGDSKKAEREKTVKNIILYLVIFVIVAWLWKHNLWKDL